MLTIAQLSGCVSTVFWLELSRPCFFSDRSDVERQTADVSDGGPAREGAPRHEEKRIRGREMEWLWGESSGWRIYRRCCKEVNYFENIHFLKENELLGPIGVFQLQIR